MKKMFVFAAMFAAVALVSCGGQQKAADDAKECADCAKECVDCVDCDGECGGDCDKECCGDCTEVVEACCADCAEITEEIAL